MCDKGLSCADGACIAGDTIVQIEAIVSTQFARTADGRVLVWGNNKHGKGNPRSDAEFILKPEQLDLPEPVVDVRPSRSTACARGISGRVWCWGAPDAIPGAAPGERTNGFVAVAGVTNARALMVSGEGHCVFDVYQRGLCWSPNDSRELATGSGWNVQLPLLFSVEMSAVDENLVTLLPSIAAVNNGPVLVWGYPGTLGRPVPQPAVNVETPLPVPGLIDPVRVEGGKLSYCATLRDGRVFCWGQEILSATSVAEPFLAFEHGPYKKVGVSLPLCALSAAGRVECFDPLEHDTERDGVADISSGIGALCLLMQDHRLLCKGDNSEAQQGNGTLGGYSIDFSEVHLPVLP